MSAQRIALAPPRLPAPEPGAPAPGMSGAALLSYLLGLAEAHRRILAHVEQLIPHDDECAPLLREAASLMDARVRRLRRLLAET